jgi:predicted nucleotidyltransferase
MFMERAILLNRIKETVRELEPEADLVLFGSHARNQATPESDWDILILLNGFADEQRKRQIRRRIYEIEWDIGEVIDCLIKSKQDWESPLHQITPFHKQIMRAGVSL